VECGVFDVSMVEGRLRLAVEAPQVPRPRRRWWSRLLAHLSSVRVSFLRRWFARAAVRSNSGADETMRVEKLPFDLNTLYDDAGDSSTANAPRPSSFEQVVMGHCNRCWRQAPLTSGQLCARCAIRHG
jgi:hypothetical protein